MIRFLSGAGRRYPLYTGLTAMLAGCALCAALAFWGSVEVERQFSQVFGRMVALCAGPAATGTALCDVVAGVERGLLERVAVMLLLQGLCLLALVVGCALIAHRAYRLLVCRSEAALSLMPESSRARGRDEIERLVESLAELTARQAGLEAEVRWRQQVTAEQLRRKALELQTLHQVARTFSNGEVSAFSLLGGLAQLEAALGARTVALSLGTAARLALGSDAVLATHGEPAILSQLADQSAAREITARVLPPNGHCTTCSLVLPVCRGDLALGTLVAEFPEHARVDDSQVKLAESFAHLAALAISAVSHSQEERRVALMEERTAIAGELHDSLAQSLAYMKIQVARLQQALDREKHPADVAQAARELREGLSAAYRVVRDLIAAFRVRMGPGGLLSSVQATVDEFSQRSGLDISFVHDLGRCQLGVNEEFHVMQVIREAVSNTVRHARAYHVWVSMHYGPGHLLTVIVDDDGRGLTNPYVDANHYGLSIMRERASSLGGEVTVVHRPGGGTRVQLAFAPQKLPADILSDLTT